MPFVRCKFYTESGEPLRGGCHRRGMGCAFVHPGDSDWTNAPPPSIRAKDRSGNSGFKSWGEQDKRAAATSSAFWNTGGNTSTSPGDTGNGWDTGGGWGSGWDTGITGGTGGGWDMGASTSISNQVSESTRSKNILAKSSDTAAYANGSQPGGTTSGNTKGSEDGSGWGSGWGESKDAGPTWGGAPNDGWGSGWGDNKGASTWGSAPNDEWGNGWGSNKDSSWGTLDSVNVGNQVEKKIEQDKGKGRAVPAPPPTSSWGASDPITMDNQVGEKTKQDKSRSKAVLAPPRIRIPGNESKKAKITGTNNEPLGTSKWGESRNSNFPSASTPITASTPIATLTPIDSSHGKRKRDVAFDEKSDAFREYIKAWERGVRTRILLAEAEAKRDRWVRTQKSACYARVGEAGRNRLDGYRAECDKEVNSHREKLSCAITSLVKFHDAISSNLDLGQRYNISEETKKFIEESKVFVDKVRTLLVKHILKDKNDVSMDDADQRVSETHATSIDALRSRVQDLEERFEQAQAELTLRHPRDIGAEIEELLTAKIADLRMARQREIDHVASQPRPEIMIPPGSLKKMEETAQQVRELDAKIPHTVEDIRVLLLRVDATAKRVSELEEGLSINKEMYRKVQEMAIEKKKTERRVDDRVEKMREQYEWLVASQFCHPATQPDTSAGTCGSQDKLVESLRPAFEAMLDKFYEREVRPTIASLQQVVIEASDRHQEEAIKVLWGRIQPAMNMVAGVSRWLDSQELGHTAPVVEDHL